MAEKMFCFELDNVTVQAMPPFFAVMYEPIPKHSHSDNSYEIHYIPSGKGVLECLGKSYEISSGMLLITGPNIPHAQIPGAADPMNEYCVYMVIKRKSGVKSHDGIFEKLEANSFWLGKDRYGIDAIFEKMINEIYEKKICYYDNVCALMQELLIGVVRNCSETVNEADVSNLRHNASDGNTSGGKGNPFAGNASRGSTLSGTESNTIDEPFIIIDSMFLYEYGSVTLDGIADRIGLGRRQTERLIKEHYGMTFREKKLEARMSAAAVMLSGNRNSESRNSGTKKPSISEISDTLGYTSIEHFTTAFKRYYGMSPSEYRKQNSRK